MTIKLPKKKCHVSKQDQRHKGPRMSIFHATFSALGSNVQKDDCGPHDAPF